MQAAVRPVFLVFFVFLAAGACAAPPAQDGERFGLVIHGGGGVMPRAEMTPELESEYRAALAEALEAGYEVLRRGDTAVDAVEAAIRVMEDSPLFNAGRGSSPNIEGDFELDASIMDGRTLDAGGVAIVRGVRNPITLSRIVMERTPHVLMAAEGAERLARDHGLEPVSPDYFWTERRWEMLQRRLEEDIPYGERPAPPGQEPDREPDREAGLRSHELFGTVGAAALDRHGNLAAGTSTGGRIGKMPGRVGDSPIIGAGTWADNNTVAVSSTGLGEYVLRLLGTRSVGDLVAYRGLSVDDAVEEVRQRFVYMGATISMIAIDPENNISMRYSGDGMYRGYVRQDGQVVVKVYED